MSLPPNPFTSSFIPSDGASLSSKARGKQIQIEKCDWISQLDDDTLLKILSKLCTEDAIKTSVLSQRWKNSWKQVPRLAFDMKNAIMFGEHRYDKTVLAELITKVIQNHNGHLESCKIQHYPEQSEDGTLETWIQSLTQEKHTKRLALLNIERRSRAPLQLSPNIFSHPSLTSLFLLGYDLGSAQPFNNCNHLMTLKLDNICAEVSVFNTVLASCPSLKVLILDIMWHNEEGCLKIHHNNLKMLHLACTHIDLIHVATPLLDIFAIQCDYVTRTNFFLEAPRITGLIRKYNWVLDEITSHVYYNISSDAQEIKNILHEFVVTRKYVMRYITLVVNVDFTNPQEVYMLKEVCDAWLTEMEKLVIFFKHNNVTKEEGQSFIGGAQKEKAKEKRFFINDDFRVRVVWMYNLGDLLKEAFEFTALLVTEGTVMYKLMIETSSIPTNKKLKIQEAVAKLEELPKGNKELTIQCF